MEFLGGSDSVGYAKSCNEVISLATRIARHCITQQQKLQRGGGILSGGDMRKCH